MVPLLLLISLLASRPAQSEWPRFRGPNGSGVADQGALPAEFGPAKNVVWKTAAPLGSSSPVVAGGRIWLTGYEGDSRFVVCIDRATGAELWRRSLVAPGSLPRTPPNDPAAPTPVTDGGNVYALFPDIGLVSYAPDGRERWRVSLPPFTTPHGMAASPVLAAGSVILVADQVTDSYIAAYGSEDGRLQWKAERPSFVGGYATPVVIESGLGESQVLVCGPLEVISYSAVTGKQVWSTGPVGVHPISSPVMNGRTIYVNTGSVPPFQELAVNLGLDKNKDGRIDSDEFGNFGEAVRAIDRTHGDGDGAVEAAEWDRVLRLDTTANAMIALKLENGANHRPARRLWQLTRGLPDVPSPLVYRGVLYLVKDGGIVRSLDPRTGTLLREGRLTGAIGRYFASPVAGDGKIYMIEESGKVSVLVAGRKWKLARINDLNEECVSTPAVAGGCLFIRTRQSLYCFGTSSRHR
jgi:outer membrane protein assembly factor BamB